MENGMEKPGMVDAAFLDCHQVLLAFNASNAYESLDEICGYCCKYEFLKAYGDKVEDIWTYKMNLLADYLSNKKDQKPYEQDIEQYGKLKDKIYEAILDVVIKCHREMDPVLRKLYENSVSVDQVLDMLAEPVADLAMLDLQDGLSKMEKLDQQMVLQNRLNDVRGKFFGYCLTDGAWNQITFQKYKELMDSSSLDSPTKQVTVSGIMLACLDDFDYEKWRMLLYIYRSSQDIYVKQRALVALMLLLPHIPTYYEERAEKDIYELNQEDKNFRRTLLMVSKLLVRTANADEDSHNVRKILLKGLVNAASHIISEKLDGDDDYDVYDDDEDEQQEETGEKTVFRLSKEESEESDEFENMAKEMFGMLEGGADIYYQQFKACCDDEFFKTTLNWFLPFYQEHPLVLDIRHKLGEINKCFDVMYSNSTMCNNDLYSFLLAMPKDEKKLRNMVSQIIPPDSDIPVREETDPKKLAFRVTASCLQDLYRFFTLAPMRSAFFDPFEVILEDPVAPIDSLLICPEEFDKVRLPLARYCLAQKEYDSIITLLEPMNLDTLEYHYMLAKAYDSAKEPNLDLSLKHAKALLEAEPDNQRFQLVMIDVCHDAKHLREELQYINHVLEQDCSEHVEKELLKHKVVCLRQVGELDEAVKFAYQLYYDYPEEDCFVALLGDVLLKRSPADPEVWDKVIDLVSKTLDRKKDMLTGAKLSDMKDMSPEQCMEEMMRMMKLLGSVDHTFEPQLFALSGICYWLKNDLKQAMSDFLNMLTIAQSNMKKAGEEVEDVNIDSYIEPDLLRANGIGDDETNMILNLITANHGAYMQEKEEELKAMRKNHDEGNSKD